MAYSVDLHEYAIAPRFLWEHAAPIHPYRHAAMHNFYVGWEATSYRQRAGWYGVVDKTWNVYRFFFAHLLFIPLVAGITCLRHRRTRPLWFIAVFLVVGFLPEVWLQAHYAAVALGILYTLPLLGCRRLRMWPNRHHPKGLLLVWMVPILAIVLVIPRFTAYPYEFAVVPPYWNSWVAGLSRKNVVEKLEKIPGDHLVFAHYTIFHNPHEEWVYNASDIQHSRIMWAREIGPESDAALIQHYPERTVWLLEADGMSPHVEPYPMAQLRAAVACTSQATRTDENSIPCVPQQKNREPGPDKRD
jgi:hypothetical protein